jgi:hypothetical protein
MKTFRTMALVGTTVVLGCVLTGVLVNKRQGSRDAAASQAKAALPTKTNRAESQPRNAAPVLVPVTPEPLAVPEKATQAETMPAPGSAKLPPTATVPNLAAGTAASSAKDSLAREALSLVGADPDAEAYWIEAINDTHLSAEERQNLIEDLNEDGLSDPKHPTADDLPLIVNRLLLIEDLAPEAMDSVNYDAFDEAYKDLLNLADLAVGGGKRVN